jgi:hypothetical protein
MGSPLLVEVKNDAVSDRAKLTPAEAGAKIVYDERSWDLAAYREDVV